MLIPDVRDVGDPDVRDATESEGEMYNSWSTLSESERTLQSRSPNLLIDAADRQTVDALLVSRLLCSRYIYDCFVMCFTQAEKDRYFEQLNQQPGRIRSTKTALTKIG